MINLYVSYILNLCILSYFAYKTMQSRFSNIYRQTLYYIMAVILILLITESNISFRSTVIIMIINFAYISLFFKGKFITKIFVFLGFYIISFNSEIVVANSTTLITKKGIIDVSSFVFVIAMLLSSLMTFSLIYCLAKLIKMANKNKLPYYSYGILILPITLIALILNLNSYVNLLQQDMLFFICLICLFISVIFTVFILYKVIQSIEAENEYKQVMYREMESRNRLNLITDQYNSSFQFLHEILHVVSKITQENKEVDLSELSDYTYSEFNKLYTNSIIIGSLLKEKHDILEKNHILMRVKLEYSYFEPINLYDQYILFSNIIEDIINYLGDDDTEKIIIMKSKYINNSCVITIQYRYDGSSDLLFENEDITEIKNKYNLLISTEVNVTQKLCELIIIICNKNNSIN